MPITRRIWLAAALAAVVLPCGALLASAGLREYVYREVSYLVVTDRIVPEDATPEQTALLLNDFISVHQYPGGGPVLDITAWSDLVRGIGWCDQDSWLLSTLLATRGVRARLAFLNADDRSSAHTVAEVLIDDEWRMFDPLLGATARHPEGQDLATLAELHGHPEWLLAHPRLTSLPPATFRKVTRFYDGLVGSKSAVGGRRTPDLIALRGESGRGVLQIGIRAAYRVFGRWGAERLQDLYLALLPDGLPALDASGGRGNRPVRRLRAEDPALYVYYRARNYDLYDRTGPARQLYTELLEHHPTSSYADDSRYFLALMTLEEEGNPGQAAALLREFLSAHPDSPWAVRAHVALGQVSERLGDVAAARRHYAQAAADENTPAAMLLARLGLNAGAAQ